MTETEITDRLREAIVLNGPDIWRSNGYLQDAQQAGLSLADAIKRATEITQEVDNNKLLFQNIQARIARLSQPSRHQLIEQDLNQIINAASSLKLSADFVRNQWVPTVLAQITASKQPAPTQPTIVPPALTVIEPVVSTPDTFEELIESEPEIIEPNVPAAEPVRPFSPPVEPTPVRPVTPPPPVVEQPVKPSGPPEPAPVVRSFTATPARVRKGQPVTLDGDVENLLAVTIDDLGEGLSPKNRGWVKPTKTAEYTLFDANDNPLSTVRVEVIPPDRSGVYGVLFALALLAVIYWFIKSNNARESAPPTKRKPEQTTRSQPNDQPTRKTRVSQKKTEPEPTSEASDTRIKPTSEPIASVPDVKKKVEPPISKPVEQTTSPAEPAIKPSTPADARQGKYEESFGDKPYDKVELGTDERGWRRARYKGRWGYINEDDEWVIKPEYEAVTPFRGNTAAVFLNGQLMTINRAGEQIKK